MEGEGVDAGGGNFGDGGDRQWPRDGNLQGDGREWDVIAG